jgi:hydroxypyruvate isomerase
MNRREFSSLGLSAIATLAAPRWAASASTSRTLRQGVARSVFGDMPLEACCRLAHSLGVEGFDFICDPSDWATLRRYGLTVSMLRADYGGGISIGRSPQGPPGWNEIGLPEARGEYLQAIRDLIDVAARERFPNVIVLAGTRDRVSYEEGAENAVAFLNEIKSHAEARGVTLCMENLNSMGRMAPKLSLFDHAAWGFEVVRRVDSPRVRILYDIWHAQLMDGNILQTLRDQKDWIGHVHIGSVPDRHELYLQDELDFRVLGEELRKLDYRGFVTHEWSPSAGADVHDALKRSMALLHS